VVRPSLVLSCETEVDQFDVFVFVEEDVLKLEVSMDTGLIVNIANCADELCKDLLYFRNGEWTVLEQVVVEFIALWKSVG
jgi:hypothetical protein